jgi:hypothetical protein
MAAAAVISAVLTAAIVIGAGEALLDRREADRSASQAAPLIRTGG